MFQPTWVNIISENATAATSTRGGVYYNITYNPYLPTVTFACEHNPSMFGWLKIRILYYININGALSTILYIKRIVKKKNEHRRSENKRFINKFASDSINFSLSWLQSIVFK